MGGVVLRCIKILVVLSLTACIILSAIGVSATDYTPNSIFYFRPNTATVYANVEGGGNSFPIAVNSNGNWLSAQTGLFVGATYNGSGDNFVNHETYKLVMTFSAAATTSLTNPEASYLVGLPAAPAAGLYNWKDRIESDIRPIATGVGSSAITITFEDIPWSFMAGVSTVGVFIPKASMNVSGAIILLNCYLDLTSEYDELAYQKEVNERLDRIQNSLDGVQDSLDGVQDSLGGIQDSIDGILDEEEDRLNDASDIAKDDSEGALSLLKNYADQYGNIMEQFITICTTNSVLTEIPLPSGSVNIFGHNLDIFAGQDSIDFSGFVNDPNIQIVLTICKCVTTLGILASAVHWAHSIKEWFTADSPSSRDVPEIPFLEGGK